MQDIHNSSCPPIGNIHYIKFLIQKIFWSSVSPSVLFFLVSAIPLKPLNRISGNLVVIKDIQCIFSCSREILNHFFGNYVPVWTSIWRFKVKAVFLNFIYLEETLRKERLSQEALEEKIKQHAEELSKNGMKIKELTGMYRIFNWK